MAEGLTAFLQRTWERPFVWGESDCTLWVADWCKARWGMDPAGAFRGRYSTQAEAERLTARGLAVTVRPYMTFAREKEAADEGDVGVVIVDGKETSAIRAGGQWLIKTPLGVGAHDFLAVAIWGD